MAVYGVDVRTGAARNGSIPFTGWSPILVVGQPVFASGQGNGVVQFNGQSQNDDRVAKQFRKMGPANKILKTMLSNLIGGTVGAVGTGTTTYKQVKGQSGDSYTSNRAIEVVGLTNRTSTTDDQAAFRGMINRLTAPATYAVDLSGAGGGGKVRY